MKKTALFSVNESPDTLEFATTLSSNGWDIITVTDAVYKLLNQNDIPAMLISDFTGHPGKYSFPATLHPEIEAALTLEGFPKRIDLVYDITYGPDGGFDVGGNTLLALAVKGRRIPVTSAGDMKLVAETISKQGTVPEELQKSLISTAIQKISEYYQAISEDITQDKAEYLKLNYCYSLLNGENPYQKAEVWSIASEKKTGLLNCQLISENKPCFTNVADINSITETMIKLSCAFRLYYNKSPFIAIAAKHGNPCGVGIDWKSRKTAIEKSLWGNPLAVWGGEVIVNFALDVNEAAILVSDQLRKERYGDAKWMLDVIIAAGVNQQAKELIDTRKNTKIFIDDTLLSIGSYPKNWDYRFIKGAVVKQTPADYIIDISRLEWNLPDDSCKDNIDDILIAWATAYTSFHGGNEIALARNRQLLACAGGPSTLDAAETASLRTVKLHKDLNGASFAADAFFPFTDGPSVLAGYGVSCGVVPCGGIRQKEIEGFFSRKNIKIGFIPAEFRGFCRH